MHLDHLVYTNPTETCEILVGTFYWTTPQGEQCDAKFYVKTCTDATSDQQVNDLNEQMTDEWSRLICEGATAIKFLDVTPNPFF